ncbi:hypothetical protein ABMA27_002583 [Loxostege sticticalis]|uniref:Cytochrome P450 n=1 Tax=Loxostege sticticalis TaxID=481309 RepID=A0ABR3HU61_LOXSC
MILEIIFSHVLSLGGGVCRAMIGTKPFYLISDPEDCLAVANSCLSKPTMPYAFLNTYLGKGIISVQDVHEWKPRRKVMNPVFSQKRLDEFLHVFNGETRGLVEKLKHHVGAGSFDHTVYLKTFTLESIVRTAMDIVEEDSESKNVIIEDTTRLIELSAMRITNFWLYSEFVYRLTAYGKEERERKDRLNRVTEKIVNKKKTQLQELNTLQLDDRKFKPFLDTLLELEDSGVFTREDIMDQLHTIILGGYHTTAITLSFILCAVGTYPKVQDRIYCELQEIFGTCDRDVEKKDLPNLVYLEAVIKETLRLYPIVPAVARHGDTAVRLKEYTIPKNSDYILILSATNHLPMWGQDRYNFRPERWLDPATIPENANAFNSFSLGKRACIGRTYAMNLMKVACAHIFRQFKIKSNINKLQLRLDILYSIHGGHEINIEIRRNILLILQFFRCVKMLFLLFIYVILSLWTYSAYTRNLSRDKAPPIILMNHCLPIIGHLHYFLFGDSAHILIILEIVLNEILRLGGGVFRVMMGPKTFYLISDPEDCHTVANSCLSKPSMPYAFFNTLLGKSILNIQDAHVWKPLRKIMNPVFSQKKLDEFLHVFNEESRGLMEKLTKHVGTGPLDHTVYLKNFTLESIVKTALDIVEEDSESKNVIIEESTRLIELTGMRITNFWLYTDFVYRLTAYGKEERERKNRFNRVTEQIVNKKKMQLKELNTLKLDDRKFKTFLDTLIELEDNGVFTRKEVMDQIHTIIVGGYHTTAITLSLILCVVGTYPKVQDRIYSELKEIFGSSYRDVEKKDLTNLVYLEAVIKETLRLYAIAPVITRRGDTELKLKGYTIPKNSYYVLLLCASNRFPMWGQDRHDFRPERWLDPATIPEANAFNSFSSGKRACIGRTYAMNLMKVTCAHLFRQFKIKSNINKLQLRLDILYKIDSGHEISIDRRL